MKGQFPAVLWLGSLNGQNGFNLDGEPSGSISGDAASGAGDINKDGYADFLIGDPWYNSKTGRTYLIFWGPQVGSGGSLSLSNLNGANGFKMDGEVSGEYVSYPVSTAGDINGDNYTDFLVGGYGYASSTGRSYLVFGGPSVGSSGTLSLSSLSGTNGFKLEGEVSGDWCGSPLTQLGDVNADGHNDFLVGSTYHASYTGRSYVVFGGPSVGSTGDISLSSLNGANGYKIDGEASGDWSSIWASAAGDINGDGVADILIGAYQYTGSTIGRSYVVFGGSSVGSSGTLSLSSLNGANGFKLIGEASGDYSGYSVNSLGDINADGHADLVIGAYGHASGAGRTYVVFGGPGVGSSGSISLSGLNGANGFVLDGETSGDNSGYVVRIAGDVNGDGHPDLLIGAYHYNSSAGRTYVVFGGLGVGSSGSIPLSSLNGVNGFKLDGEAANDWSSIWVSAAGDVNGDGVGDILIGAYKHAPTGRSYIVFGDAPPVLINNSLNIFKGQTILLSDSMLGAYDQNHNNATLQFTMSGISHGYFEKGSNPGVQITTFTQQQVANNSIFFVHDNSTQTPAFSITINSGGIAWTGPVLANITFSLTPPVTSPTPMMTTGTPTPIPTFTPTSTVTPTPVLVNNQLTIGDGQTVVLSSANLQAVEYGFSASNLVFYISNIQNGYFSLLPTNASVTRFLQSYVQNGQVQFVHSGDHQAPSYLVVVSDGSQVTVPSLASVNFIGAPSVTATPVTVTPGGSTTLTTSNLNVTNTSGSSSNQIVFQVSNVQNGQFVLNGSSTPITNFTLMQLINHDVQLVQDNSNIAPSYSVSVADNTGLSSATTPVTAQLCTSLSSSSACAPMIVRNNLWVKQGAFATLSSQNLYATTTSGQTLPANTVFYVTNVNHGYFNVNGSSSSFFTEQQLQEGVVQFVDDGSNVAPSYQIAVQSSGLQTNGLAQVTLGFVNKPPYLSGALPNQVAAVDQPFTLAIGPSVFTDPQGDPLILSADLYNSTQSLPAWLSFNPGTNRFSGVPTESGVIDIGVTATDPEGLSTEGEFSLTVLNQSSGGNNSLTTTIASSVVSGTIGLFFLLLKICLQRAANKKLDEALGDTGDYEQKVVRPLGRAIAQRLKITGFMGHTTNREMRAFKDAVGTLLGCLLERGINLEDSQLNESRRAYLINEIAVQTKEYFLPSNRHCCRKSCRSAVSFFTSEVTPHQITTAAAAIAEAVVQAQRQHKSSAVQLGLMSSSQSGCMSPPASPTQLEDTTTAVLS